MSCRMTKTFSWRSVAALGSTIGVLGACGGELPDDPGAGEADRAEDGPIDSESAAFSGNSIHSQTQQGIGTTTTDIGSDNGHTCFLAGIAGNLNGAHYGSIAGVYRSEGRWKLRTSIYSGADSTTRIRVKASCVNSAAGLLQNYSWFGGSRQLIGPATAARRCFLTEVSAGHGGFGTLDDEVRVFSDGANWYIGGTGDAGGRASCIDVAEDKGLWGWFDATNAPLAYNDGAPGTQCFLTGVRGHLRLNSVLDGPNINYNAGSGQYTMTTGPLNGAVAQCVE
jgi:hypothetical protein